MNIRGGELESDREYLATQPSTDVLVYTPPPKLVIVSWTMKFGGYNPVIGSFV
jgi:hypothetical protein